MRGDSLFAPYFIGKSAISRVSRWLTGVPIGAKGRDQISKENRRDYFKLLIIYQQNRRFMPSRFYEVALEGLIITTTTQ